MHSNILESVLSHALESVYIFFDHIFFNVNLVMCLYALVMYALVIYEINWLL